AGNLSDHGQARPPAPPPPVVATRVLAPRIGAASPAPRPARDRPHCRGDARAWSLGRSSVADRRRQPDGLRRPAIRHAGSKAILYPTTGSDSGGNRARATGRGSGSRLRQLAATDGGGDVRRQPLRFSSPGRWNLPPEP